LNRLMIASFYGFLHLQEEVLFLFRHTFFVTFVDVVQLLSDVNDFALFLP